MSYFKLNNCSQCDGLCCLNPPEIKSVNELSFAIQNGAKPMALQVEKNKFVITLARDERGNCNFLSDTGECTIYENRFEACRLLDCKIISENGIDLLNLLNGKIGEDRKASEPFYVDKKTIKSFKVEVADQQTIMEKAFLIDLDLYLKRVNNLVSKNKIKTGAKAS